MVFFFHFLNEAWIKIERTLKCMKYKFIYPHERTSLGKLEIYTNKELTSNWNFLPRPLFFGLLLEKKHWLHQSSIILCTSNCLPIFVSFLRSLPVLRCSTFPVRQWSPAAFSPHTPRRWFQRHFHFRHRKPKPTQTRSPKTARRKSKRADQRRAIERSEGTKKREEEEEEEEARNSREEEEEDDLKEVDNDDDDDDNDDDDDDDVDSEKRVIFWHEEQLDRQTSNVNVCINGDIPLLQYVFAPSLMELGGLLICWLLKGDS